MISGKLEISTGIIPAYAGSTHHERGLERIRRGSSPHTRGALVQMIPPILTETDHPRIRGEHKGGTEYTVLFPGIIPAYAGSTLNDLRNYTAFLNS